MKSKRKSENLCFTVCDVILCFLMVVVSLNIVVDGGMANDNQKILSRRRRYLIFPEGSSFQVAACGDVWLILRECPYSVGFSQYGRSPGGANQHLEEISSDFGFGYVVALTIFVYETYHPIVDYGNLLLFYLTQAMAWELPYEAYHPEEHLQDLWDDVIFPQDQYDDYYSPNNQDQNLDQNIATNQIQNQDNVNGNGNSQNLLQNEIQNQNQQGLQFQNKNQQAVQFQNRKDDLNLKSRNSSRVQNAYYSNSYNTPASNPSYYANYRNPPKLSGTKEPLTSIISNKMDYYFSYADKVLNQIADYATQKHTPWSKTDWTTNTGSQPSYYRRQEANRRDYAQRQSRHFIHPVFGKRSTDQNVMPEEKFNLNFHRTSRQTMYTKISKFLESDEINGSECVLKALCETGKRRDSDEKPAPFLMEIMRAIFSLPEAFDKEVNPLYSQYDHAHNALTDCEQLFPKCKSTLWNKHLILQ